MELPVHSAWWNFLGGEHTSGQLADVVGYEFRISRTAGSKHLRLLRDAGCVDVRAEENWRWYRLDKTGFEALEHAVADLRAKVDSAIGWDADERQKRDPLRALVGVPFKGPGRTRRPGLRGTQTTFDIHPSPDDIPPWRMPIDLGYDAVADLLDPDHGGRRRLEA
ncbi:helix-turn-helix transcriptional regulator [Microbacterium sp. NEAU-LLC]|uniref:Helix-turn-helix transcriptional regulator n=1 Tax=Microbacterium helvum TaxID=2773713 RepID=A0ABR8NP81_9MICO|nr:helix-turn-helix domain-containing protein [Microbacterium helvum]MBD3942454.1 helix-turn-helix transcriptional regulator [Microbacterium helvum]